MAVENGLAGVGFWNLDCLDHGSDDGVALRQTAEMWEAVRTAFADPAPSGDTVSDRVDLVE